MAHKVSVWFNDSEFDATEVEVDYVSLLNDKTFGIPPLMVGSRDDNTAKASPGESILYVNTALLPLFKVETSE